MTTLSKSLLAGCSVLICIAPDCSGENARDEEQLAFQEVKSAQEAAIARIFDHGKAQVRRRDWKGFASKLEELMRTEPDNVDVWKLAAWNQVYNLSAEDAESQYEGIKRAISILLRGIAVQPDNAILLHETAWYIGQKIGFDKDAMRMRSKLRNDAGLHGALAQYIDLSMAFGVDGKPDNWRISKLWYEKAVEAYDRDPRSIGAKSPVVFCSTVPMATFGYAMAIEAEGYCGQEAVEAWQNAVEELNKLAERPFKIERFDQSIRLGDLESLERELRSRGLEDPLQDEQYFLISNLRLLVNFDEWLQRCELEQSEQLRNARRSLYLANQKTRVVQDGVGGAPAITTRQLFDEAFVSLARAYSEHPSLIRNGLIYEDVEQAITTYQTEVLLGQELPESFPLRPVIQYWKNVAQQSQENEQ